jgi:hypothetical protein
MSDAACQNTKKQPDVSPGRIKSDFIMHLRLKRENVVLTVCVLCLCIPVPNSEQFNFYFGYVLYIHCMENCLMAVLYKKTKESNEEDREQKCLSSVHSVKDSSPNKGNFLSLS